MNGDIFDTVLAATILYLQARLEFRNICHFVDPVIFRISHKGYSCYTERFRNGSEKIGLWVLLAAMLRFETEKLFITDCEQFTWNVVGYGPRPKWDDVKSEVRKSKMCNGGRVGYHNHGFYRHSYVYNAVITALSITVFTLLRLVLYRRTALVSPNNVDLMLINWSKIY